MGTRSEERQVALEQDEQGIREREAESEGMPPEPPPQSPEPLIVPRNVQLVLLGVGLLATWAAASAARRVVLVFIVAALIALILNPIISWVHRRWIPRGLAVLVVYISFFSAVGGTGYLLSGPISGQVTAFNRNVPHLVSDANKRLSNLQDSLDKQGIHLQLRKQGKTALQTVQEKVVKGSSSIVSFSGGLLKNVAAVSLDLVLILVLSVYMLLYAPQVGRVVREWMPVGDGSEEDDYPLRVQQAVSSYVQGQLLFSVVMGFTAGLMLYLYGVLGVFPQGRTYAVAFGAFLGVMELVPFIGPILGALPPILVALFSDPLTAVWVALLFLALQQIEGHIVAPQIFGHALRINPLLVIFALLFGQALYGLVGALVALPMAAVVRETVVYLRRHVVFERWHARAPR